MLINFPPHMRNKGNEMSTVLQEMSSVQFRKPQGRPKYSAPMIWYALLLRFTSCQAYKIYAGTIAITFSKFIMKNYCW